MRRKELVIGFIFLLLALVATANAQFQMRRPDIRGIWSPVVGQGAAYVFESKAEGKQEFEMAIVGTETVEGKTGHWLEMAVKDREMGTMVMKQLMVAEGETVGIKRVIVQMGDEPPMEFAGGMMMRGQQKPQPADARQDSEKVGTESVTTPAGTFDCEHWRAKDKSGDFWISTKVAPYGLVKMTSADGTMTLVRVLTNAKSRIKGTPQKFDPAEMMRQRPE